MDIDHRKDLLIATVEMMFPDFAKSCKGEAVDILVHQDAFAADYQPTEYTLLGMAVKYAGLHGRSMIIHGKNRETLGEVG